MNFVLLEELINKRKDLIILTNNLRKSTYEIVLYNDGMTLGYFPSYINKKLKDFAIDECEKELKSIEQEIERLK